MPTPLGACGYVRRSCAHTPSTDETIVHPGQLEAVELRAVAPELARAVGGVPDRLHHLLHRHLDQVELGQPEGLQIDQVSEDRVAVAAYEHPAFLPGFGPDLGGGRRDCLDVLDEFPSSPVGTVVDGARHHHVAVRARLIYSAAVGYRLAVKAPVVACLPACAIADVIYDLARELYDSLARFGPEGEMSRR